MFSYIQWNPNPDIVFFSLLNRSIKWYGFLFALGFFIAYSLGRFFLKTFLLFRKDFTSFEVKNWNGLFQDLKYKRETHFLRAFFSKDLQTFIENSSRNTEVPKNFQKEILIAMNHSFKPQTVLSYAGANRWERFVLRWIHPQVKPFVKHRLALEHLLSEGLKKTDDLMRFISERIILFLFTGMVVGARLGHLFFYRSPEEYLKDPLLVFRIWEGGLSSHGATVGILLMLLLGVYQLKKHFSFINMRWLLDIVVTPVAFAACMIRLGNFMNQELIGFKTTVPWAVVFLNPADGIGGIPRHPVQVYEAIAYFFIGISLLVWVYRSRGNIARGKIAGAFLMAVFSTRFIVDFFKERLSIYDAESFLAMGQILSIPLVAFGAFLFFRKRDERENLFGNLLELSR